MIKIHKLKYQLINSYWRSNSHHKSKSHVIRSKRLKSVSKIMLMMKNPRSKNMSYDQIHKIKTE